MIAIALNKRTIKCMLHFFPIKRICQSLKNTLNTLPHEVTGGKCLRVFLHLMSPRYVIAKTCK